MLEFLRRLARDRFAKRVRRAIAAAGGPADFVYDRAAFALRRKEATAFLGNTYQSYRQARGPLRARVLANAVAAFARRNDDDLSDFSQVESSLVAVVRERAFLAALEGPGWGLGNASAPDVRPVQAAFSQWFSKALVVDYPTHVAVVNRSHLKSWGMTFDEVFALGLAKLRDSTLPRFRPENGYFVGEWHDDYDSSRILIPSLFDDLPLDGDPVVTLPNRRTLMVAGANQADAIRAMLAKAETIVRDLAKPQNPSPLVVRNGVVSDFRVASTSPIFHAVQRARKFAGLATYTDQKANLDRHYQQSGKDIFVAAFTLNQAPTGQYTSSSVWSKGVATLLPETDVVMFHDADQPEAARMVARAAWHQVTAVLGDLMLDTRLFPPRHFVAEFPSPEQLAILRANP